MVSAKGRRGTGVKEVSRVQRIVAEKFKYRAMPGIGSGLRDDDDLGAGMFAELRAVGIAQNIELPHGIDPQ